MSALLSLSFSLLWSQAPLAGLPASLRPVVGWLYVFGEPTQTLQSFWGGPLTWLKVMSIFCLLAWVGSWLASALKDRTRAGANWLDFAALAALLAAVGAVLLRVLESTKRIDEIRVGRIDLATIVAFAVGAILFLWVESALWKTIRRHGGRNDLLVLLGIHLGLALGPVVAFLYLKGLAPYLESRGVPAANIVDKVIISARSSATFMGYAVLIRVIALVFVEVAAVRSRRLFAIARLTVLEATRRMWAPWVVIVIFAVVLAFTHWFLHAPRPAEMGRLFVTTLTLLCSLLLTAMVTILTPLSLPYDIQNQTIYTVVTKPVRRIELIWGRMIGFMAIVSMLVVLFYSVSLFYLKRNVGGAIEATKAQARKEEQASRLTQARQLYEQADQMSSRMAARVPIPGSLSFIDSRGNPHATGIDVGADQGRMPRSHIEGGTPASAIWLFGRGIPDPYRPKFTRDRVIPVDDLLKADSIEGLANRIFELRLQIAAAERERADPKVSASRGGQLSATISRNQAGLEQLVAAYEKMVVQAREFAAEAKALPADRSVEAARLRAKEAELHSSPIPLEMTFNVYRTTKAAGGAVIGDPVFAEIRATNPNTLDDYKDIVPIHEYYTNKLKIPARVLAGSLGALKVEVRCVSPTQYLGMAESDLYLLAPPENFGLNFFKGLFGVWLQAMVLTAIGVFAGTFLSWPVALLTTIAFFISGLLAIDALMMFTQQSILGGGPFESLIRLVNHDNQMSELTPTLAVVTAKTFDALVMPIMSRLVYVVPNFKAFDVSNVVAGGYNVSWMVIVDNVLLACAYALPFSIAGYFILKNREVAA